MAASRSKPKAAGNELDHGVLFFLDQLIETLTIEQASKPLRNPMAPDAPRASVSEIGSMAALHGRDLLQRGYTLEQVVRDYGMSAKPSPVSLIKPVHQSESSAVNEYAYRQAAVTTEDGFEALSLRLGHLAHELRNYLHIATYAVKAIKAGSVGMSGTTGAGAVLDRSLIGMRNLIDRSLAEVRVTAGLLPRLKTVRLADF